MRSTQFDEHALFQDEPEEYRLTNAPDTLCKAIKCLGFAQNDQVRLYGNVFDLVSDPVIIGANIVFVDAVEQRSGKVMRVRIPPKIVQRARKKSRVA